MLIAEMKDIEDQWVDGREELRWRTTLGTTPEGGARRSSTSLLEVEPGHALPRHTDSAEETVVVVAGLAELEVDGETGRVPPGGVALVPEGVPHQVRSVGESTLRFVAVYDDVDVVTRYEDEVQPSGERESQTVG